MFMKKIVPVLFCLLCAAVAPVAYSQPRFIGELNLLVSKEKVIPGAFTFANVGVSKHIVISGLGAAEASEDDYCYKVMCGAAYRKKGLAIGALVGTERVSKETSQTIVAPWFTLKNKKWNALLVATFSPHDRGFIFEAWRSCYEWHHRCELEVGVLNHGQNVGPAVKYTRNNWYVFAGPTLRFVKNEVAETRGAVVTVYDAPDNHNDWFPEPTRQNIGFHIGGGIEVF